MTKKLYVSLTGDTFFKELGPTRMPPKRIWSKSPNTKLRNTEILPVVWQRPYEVIFQISSEKDEPTLLNSLRLGLIKWLGSVDTEGKKAKYAKNKNETNKVPKMTKSLNH